MNEDPKLILGAYRPNGQDANDPTFAEALAAAGRDPQLGAWFREAQEFDAAIAGKLRGVAVPENLRAKILSGARASRRQSWWVRPKLWAIAALLLVLAGVAWFWTADRSGYAPWQTHGIAVLDDVLAAKAKLDRELPESDQLVAWLQEQSAPVLPTLPDALAARPAIGCKTWEWRGLKFAMVCFHLEGTSTAHLISTFQGGLKGAPPLGHMLYAQQGKWRTATWSEGGLACMLVTDASEDGMQKLLSQESAASSLRVAFIERAHSHFSP